MTIQELSRLYWLGREVEMDKRRLADLDEAIRHDEDRLAELERTAGSVGGGSFDGLPKAPGVGPSRVEGMAIELAGLRDCIRKKQAVRTDCALAIQAKELLCLTERCRLERYIADLDDSLIRMICTYRFIDGQTWAQVSESIGMRTTEDSVKKTFYRFLDGQKD